MPKNSRPDIQVLEDRVVRLKNQLLEYKDLRLYGVTKKRLSAVAQELNECISIITDIVGEESNEISSSSLSALSEYPGEGPSEFSIDNDLLDTLLLPPFEDGSNQSTYSSKEIVKTYSVRIQNCADTVGCSSGILQVNQFCQLLNSWYQARFPAMRPKGSKFFFKADKIHEWVDLLILAAGSSLHNREFPSFVSGMNSWIKDLNTAKDQTWVLPFSVMQIKKSMGDACTEEAVLLERVVKSSIYDKDFYPDEKDSVKRIVIHNSSLTDDDLEIHSIIQSCGSRIIVTPSFDATKF